MTYQWKCVQCVRNLALAPGSTCGETACQEAQFYGLQRGTYHGSLPAMPEKVDLMDALDATAQALDYLLNASKKDGTPVDRWQRWQEGRSWVEETLRRAKAALAEARKMDQDARKGIVSFTIDPTRYYTFPPSGYWRKGSK